MVSGLRRFLILQLCNFHLCYNFKENLLHFGRVSATVLSVRIKLWLKHTNININTVCVSLCVALSSPLALMWWYFVTPSIICCTQISGRDSGSCEVVTYINPRNRDYNTDLKYICKVLNVKVESSVCVCNFAALVAYLSPLGSSSCELD